MRGLTPKFGRPGTGPPYFLREWGLEIYLVVLASEAGSGTSADCIPSLARMP